jgi:hypothetical protein
MENINYDSLGAKFLIHGKLWWHEETKNQTTPGSVKFIRNVETGEMAIYTRGEYAEALANFITDLDNHLELI